MHRCLLVHGDWTSWSSWSESNCKCCQDGSGNACGARTRSRSCTAPAPMYGGDDCTGDSSEESDCDKGYGKLFIRYLTVCHDHFLVDGGWSSWSLGTCSSSSCERLKTRNCNNPAPCGSGGCSGYTQEYGECYNCQSKDIDSQQTLY